MAKYITPKVGMRVQKPTESIKETGTIGKVFDDELDEGPGHRMVRVDWDFTSFSYEPSWMLEKSDVPAPEKQYAVDIFSTGEQYFVNNKIVAYIVAAIFNVATTISFKPAFATVTEVTK